MASASRAALLTKTHRVLKKHFKPFPPTKSRSMLDHLLFACCLENAPAAAAEKAFTALGEKFFDYNEMRVSTVRELAEVMHALPDAEGAAHRVKSVLQSVFEANYSFDLEPMKKQNIGQAIKRLEKYEGTTPFTLAYVTQAALGGHSIPVNRGALEALLVVGALSPSEVDNGRVPGLERSISKNKGVEFGSLLHQFGVAMSSNPYAPAVRKVLLEIAPDCKDRLPKRSTKHPAEPEPEAPPAPQEQPSVKAAGKEAAKQPAAKDEPADKKKTEPKKAPAKKLPSKKKAAPPPRKKVEASAKKAADKGITRRKPR